MNSWPVYADDEIAAATAVLRSGKVNYWTGGEGLAFESEFARATDCAHAIAVANGTLALDIALAALQLPAGAEVIVTPRSFVASISTVLRAGLTPVCADVELDSGNISAASIAAHVSSAPVTCPEFDLGQFPVAVLYSSAQSSI